MLLLSVVLSGFAASVSGQSELNVDMGLYGGAEYNIFKSPNVLLDRSTMLPLSSDRLLYTDMLADVEYDIEYSRTSDRSYLERGRDLWYSNYV